MKSEKPHEPETRNATLEIKRIGLFGVAIRFYPHGRPEPKPHVVLEIDAGDDITLEIEEVEA